MADENIQCPICIEPLQFDLGQGIIVLGCFHMFHTQCILEYAVSCGNRQRILSCPVCRQTIVDLEAHDEGAVERVMDRVVRDEAGAVGAVEVVTASTHAQEQRYYTARRRWITAGLGMFATLTGCVLVYWLATEMP